MLLILGLGMAKEDDDSNEADEVALGDDGEPWASANTPVVISSG